MPTISATTIPRIDQYDLQLHGHYGHFGVGANIEAFYLQTALPVARIDIVKLINEIPGSEKWSVRDLFQRDLDEKRVHNEIKPFFENPETVKFFSPLTLTLLPLLPDGQVADEMPRAQNLEAEDRNGDLWVHLTREGFYRFRYRKNSPGFCELSINQGTANLVAIDGQHRLATLKLIRQDANYGRIEDFENWIVPVVVVSFRAASQDLSPPTVLQVVRQLFTNINSEAKTVGIGRQILLNDTKPNAICTQELIERSHRNDLKPIELRDTSYMPLQLYDWRSGTENDDRDAAPINHPGGLKNVSEIHSFFKEYILDEDFSDYQKDMLCEYGNVPEELFDPIVDSSTSTPLHLAQKIRDYVNLGIVPSVAQVMDKFIPYESFIQKFREFEEDLLEEDQGSAAQWAFHEIRYGRSAYLGREAVDDFTAQIEEKVSELKEIFIPRLFERAIGMRGVMCAFGRIAEFNPEVDEKNTEDSDWWINFGTGFSRILNRAYRDGWFDIENENSEKHRLLTHIAIDPAGQIIDFRHKAIPNSFGNYCFLVLSVYALRDNGWSSFLDISDWQDALDTYEKRVTAGMKRELKPLLQHQFPHDSEQELKGRILLRATEAATKRINDLRDALVEVTPRFKKINEDLDAK